MTENTSEASKVGRVNCKCVLCKHVETFTPIPTAQPMCLKCYSPMIVVSAEVAL